MLVCLSNTPKPSLIQIITSVRSTGESNQTLHYQKGHRVPDTRREICLSPLNNRKTTQLKTVISPFCESACPPSMFVFSSGNRSECHQFADINVSVTRFPPNRLAYDILPVHSLNRFVHCTCIAPQSFGWGTWFILVAITALSAGFIPLGRKITPPKSTTSRQTPSVKRNCRSIVIRVAEVRFAVNQTKHRFIVFCFFSPPFPSRRVIVVT